MHTIKHEKPKTFYERFDRKGADQMPEVSHYCPGCGHGVVHNLVAEAIQDFGIQDRVIFCSPVGCSVFAYYYFDVGNVQCAHGRAPAVATAIRRTRSDAMVISYQGDGDLAGIGLSHIMHAANRGENITVVLHQQRHIRHDGRTNGADDSAGLAHADLAGRAQRPQRWVSHAHGGTHQHAAMRRCSWSAFRCPNRPKVMKARKAIREAHPEPGRWQGIFLC